MDDLASYIIIAGDLTPHKQLLQQLLSALIMHTQAGKIIFHTRHLLQAGDEILLEFSLIDDGCFPKRNVQNFGFFRSLVMARNLIEHLGGKTELVAVPGFKTTLKCILPFRCQATATVDTDEAFLLNIPQRKILVAEDNEVNQMVIRRILQSRKIPADFVSNGKEAIEAFAIDPEGYELILMDIQMPYMDGFQATNYIRRKLGSSIPIIALTIASGKENQIKCREVGMNHFIKKPFVERELLEAIQTHTAASYQAAC